jgi:hypothetical protein
MPMAKKRQDDDQHGKLLLETPESKKVREETEAATTLADEAKKMAEEDPVNQFLKLYAKFRESVDWIVNNPSELTDEIIERFNRTIADPLDKAWDKISIKTKDVLIDKKIV